MEKVPDWKRLDDITKENQKPSFSSPGRKTYQTFSEKSEDILKRRLEYIDSQRKKDNTENVDNQEAA